MTNRNQDRGYPRSRQPGAYSDRRSDRPTWAPAPGSSPAQFSPTAPWPSQGTWPEPARAYGSPVDQQWYERDPQQQSEISQYSMRVSPPASGWPESRSHGRDASYSGRSFNGHDEEPAPWQQRRTLDAGHPGSSASASYTHESRFDESSGHQHSWDMSCCGPYAGRGPRNYRRSDERIEEDINEHLCSHGMIDASDVEVRVSDGVVTLTGHVSDRNAKRLVEDIAEDCAGVRQVIDQLSTRQGKISSWRPSSSETETELASTATIANGSPSNGAPKLDPSRTS